ncbi:hypothetical protein ACIQVO_34535 [Streptomyces sp. NPDC101062]|uniref:hypothetical protein n=1 Tax=unclassified Streptomyces TaxID=2593676 RepID=UPI002E7A9E74|nr:hypothetical protein [Streptomyces sp. JV176]MEE1798541.1 hypothetical protein [Streptomyces sp. JV176]
MNGQRSRGRVASAATSVMCVAAAVSAVAALPGQAWAAGEPAPYAFAPDARQITGAATTSEAKALDTGAVYRDAIKPGEKRVYRLDLTKNTSDYVSAVAVPEPGTKVAFGDKIEVSFQNREGTDCSSNYSNFGTQGEFARPLAAYAYRVLKEGSSTCQESGPYYVVIERTSEKTSSATPWELEIRHVTEPGLKATGPTQAPSQWPSASPEPVAGAVRERAGGNGFTDAKGLESGEWTTKIEPGATLFYRVPVDWGQQLFASADLGSSDGDGFVGGALGVSLYNPALGYVSGSSSVSYDGKQKTTALDPLPPVAYENRFGYRSGDQDMRFAGWYYLRISLNPEVGTTFGRKPYGLTLRVDVKGTPKTGPGYDGPAGLFSVTDDDRDAAQDGQAAPDEARSDTMALVAAGGIGTGTALVLGLGVWTLLARRGGAGGGRGGAVQGP